MRNMKILFVAPRFHTNQVSIVKELLANHVEVSYAVHYRGATEDYTDLTPRVLKKSLFLKCKVWFHRRSGKNYSEEYYGMHYDASLIDLFRVMITEKPDLVVIRGKTITARKACAVATILRIPKVLYNQEPYYKPKISVAKKAMKKLYNFSVPRVRYTPVKVTEHSDLKKLEKYIVYPSTYYIPFAGEAVADAAERTYRNNGIVNFLMVGKFREYKSHRILVDAIAKLTVKEGYRFTLLGQCVSNKEVSYLKDLKDYVAQKGLSEQIDFVINIDPVKMKAYYLSHDILILPTKREDASISVIEAMHHGLSVISTSRNGTASYIDHGQSGFVFKTEDTEDLRICIEEYLADPTRVETLGRCALERSKENSSRQAYFQAFKQMLEKEFPHLDEKLY